MNAALRTRKSPRKPQTRGNKLKRLPPGVPNPVDIHVGSRVRLRRTLLGLSQSALSQHLAVLRREKIVRARKHAQSVSYSLSGDEATKVMETLHDLFCGAARRS